MSIVKNRKICKGFSIPLAVTALAIIFIFVAIFIRFVKYQKQKSYHTYHTLKAEYLGRAWLKLGRKIFVKTKGNIFFPSFIKQILGGKNTLKLDFTTRKIQKLFGNLFPVLFEDSALAADSSAWVRATRMSSGSSSMYRQRSGAKSFVIMLTMGVSWTVKAKKSKKPGNRVKLNLSGPIYFKKKKFSRRWQLKDPW
ncbi:hypothetical protein ACFL35_01420 [Candidatus Riflebacteria bacterium]